MTVKGSGFFETGSRAPKTKRSSPAFVFAEGASRKSRRLKMAMRRKGAWFRSTVPLARGHLSRIWVMTPGRAPAVAVDLARRLEGEEPVFNELAGIGAGTDWDTVAGDAFLDDL